MCMSLCIGVYRFLPTSGYMSQTYLTATLMFCSDVCSLMPRLSTCQCLGQVA